MNRKMLLFTILSLSLAGSFWALQAAQDPVQQTQTTTPAGPATTQTDLTGTYTGTFRCEAAGLTGDTTLTINGNEFTTSDGKTGRIVASTTGGYTAVALSIPGSDPTAAPTVISMRGHKRGNRLTLTPVAGSAMKCSFTPGRSMARGRRQRTPAATGTEVANPAAVPTTSPSPVPAESPMPTPTPSPSPVPTETPSPTPMPTPNPTPPTETPSPSPVPSPMPSPTPGEPMPSPTPGASPSPTVSPTPTPTPTPTPRTW
jgi:hypothetical protein